VLLNFKAKKNLQYCGDAFFYINIKEAKELLPQPWFKTFPNSNRGLNKTLMSPGQTTTK